MWTDAWTLYEKQLPWVKKCFLFFNGELHPDQKLACFVPYLKIINTFFEK